MTIDIQTLQGGAVLVALLGGGALYFVLRPKSAKPVPVAYMPKRQPVSVSPSPIVAGSEHRYEPEPEPETEEAPYDPVADLEQNLTDAETASDCWAVIADSDTTGDLLERALVKYLDFARKDLVAAATVEECLAAVADVDFDQVEDDRLTALVDEADEKLLSVIVTYDQALEYLSENRDDYDADDPEDFYGRVARKAISLATTSDECQEVYDALPSDSDLEDECNLRSLSLAETIEACAEVVDEQTGGTIDLSDSLTRAGILRLAEFIRAEDAAPQAEETEAET